MGYLVAVLVVAVPTVFAVFAPSGSPVLARVSFYCGVALNELPLYPVLWLLGVTALAQLDGALSTAVGGVGMGLAAATAAGLLVILARGLRARAALAGALQGAGLDGPGADVEAAGSLRRTALALLAPWAVRDRGVSHVRDLAYGEHRSRQLLDVYRPHAIPSGAPVLVYLHGGGYHGGRRDKEARLLVHRLAGRGWVCVSATYRTRPEAGIEDHLTDLGLVLAWVHEHVAEHGGDPARVVLAGSSAGAHLSALAALAPEVAPLVATHPHPRVEGVICLYGYYGSYYGLGPSHRPSSTPGDHARPDAPPFLVVHGDQDTYVSARAARSFATHLGRVSREVVVHAELPGAQHGFDLFRSPRFEAVVDAAVAFLERDTDPAIRRARGTPSREP